MIVMHRNATTSDSATTEGMMRARMRAPIPNDSSGAWRRVSIAARVRAGASWAIAQPTPSRMRSHTRVAATQAMPSTCSRAARWSRPRMRLPGMAVTRWPPTNAPGSSWICPPAETTSPSTRALALR